MNILFRKNIGLLYDVCIVMVCKANKRDEWIDTFVLDGSGIEEKDIMDIDFCLSKFDEIPVLDLLGYKQKNKSAFITSLYMEFLQSFSRECNIDNFVNFTFDSERLKIAVSKYYLQKEFYEEENILEAIEASDIPAKLKACLYEFYLFTEQYVNKLKEVTLRIVQIMERIYHDHENMDKIVNSRENFSQEDVLKTNKLSKHKKWSKQIVNLYVSNSLLNKYLINRGGEGEMAWMILGVDYEKNFCEEFNTPSQIAEYGNAIGDVVRVKILFSMMVSDEMTLADLTKELGTVNTIVMYHIDILKKANLIRRRYEGRKVYYWLNRSQFEKAGKVLLNLFGFGGEANEDVEEAILACNGHETVG